MPLFLAEGDVAGAAVLHRDGADILPQRLRLLPVSGSC
jgi:hypothetical protein